MYVCLIDTYYDNLSNNEKQFEVDSIMEIDKQKYEADLVNLKELITTGKDQIIDRFKIPSK